MKNHNDDDEIKLSVGIVKRERALPTVIKLNVINARVKIITFIGSTTCHHPTA